MALDTVLIYTYSTFLGFCTLVKILRYSKHKWMSSVLARHPKPRQLPQKRDFTDIVAINKTWNILL